MQELIDPTEAAEKIARIEALVAQWHSLLEERAAAEACVKQLNGVIADMEENMLPEAIAPAKAIQFADGVRVVVEETYHGHISEANYELALAELELLGRTDLLRTEVRISFGVREREAAERFIDAVEHAVAPFPVEVVVLEPLGTAMRAALGVLMATIIPDRKIDIRDTVPPATLKAFVKSQFQKGANWNAELFGAFRRTAARVIPPKEPKAKPTLPDSEITD